MMPHGWICWVSPVVSTAFTLGWLLRKWLDRGLARQEEEVFERRMHEDQWADEAVLTRPE